MIINKITGLIGLSTKAGKVVSGMDACIEEMKKGNLFLIIVSKGASDKTKKNVGYYAEKYKVPMCIYGEIEELSKAIGKKNRAIIGIKNKNLASQVQKNIDGGDIIG